VRIAFEAGPEARKLLVPGLSVTVTVDTIQDKHAREEIKREQDRIQATARARTAQ
jgi:membrane fusion protein (multidrug efflux system)